MTSSHYVEVRKSGPNAKNPQFWFRLVCRKNGEIMLTGERHPNKAKAWRAFVNAVRIIRAGLYDVVQ